MHDSSRAAVALVFGFLLLAPLRLCVAQETVFNVPNGDVLDKGKVYGELDITYRHSSGSAGFTPRVVVGVGGRIEVGLNANGIGVPGELQTTPTPTFKWKVYDGGSNGWAFLVGDEIFVPVQNRAYNVGNYLYGEFTKRWQTKTRATFGAYYFTAHVVAPGQSVGGQFAIEQPISNRVTAAADWYTGDISLGYVTPGIAIKLTPKLTWYLTYQVGNHNATNGNHQFLMEFGWNFN